MIVWASVALSGEGRLSWLTIDSDSYLMRMAVEKLDVPDEIEARAFVLSDLEQDEAARDFLASSQVILVDVMDKSLSGYLVDNDLVTGRSVFALRGSADDSALMATGFIFDADLAGYFHHLSLDNVINLGRRAVAKTIHPAISWRDPVSLPPLGIYHPDAPQPFERHEDFLEWRRATPGYDATRPWLGVMLFSSYLIPGQVEAINDLGRELERGGFNVIPAYGRDNAVIESVFLDEARNPRVDAILSFTLKFASSLTPELAQSLKDADVPVFNAISLYTQTADAWRASPEGIPPGDVAWSLGTPEISGLIEPTPLTGKVEEMRGGGRVYRSVLLHEQLANLLPRIKKWIALRRMNNADKRIAILYYNHSQGKQNIGASYLNVFRSLESILTALRADGYGIPEETGLSEEDMTALVLKSGLNIGSWAPGELDAMLGRGGAVELPLATYRHWFDALPAEFRRQVVAQWGEPEACEIMVRNDNIIIPTALRVGNVVVLPEPSRGMTDDPMKLYHDPVLYPHHQYIAAYLWLAHGFGADAMIHLGTHATYEWLPGKQAGLSPACPPEVMVADIPNLYPYIVDDVGEGLQAKRRGRGVVIDHLVPPLVQAGAYGEYAELKGLISQYRHALSMDAATVPARLAEIAARAGELGVLADIGLEEVSTAEDGEKLADYLEHLETGYAPYGVHTFGRSPDGDALADTVRAVIERNDDLDGEAIRRDVSASGTRELESLLRGLSGRYIGPGEGNDPVRNPASLPTGRNFYGFSPNRLPSPAAWELGQQAAADIIARHRDDHDGAFPDKVAVVLWAVESLRNEGLNEATILSLIGMKPVWNKRGQLGGVQPIPASELGRPRIDVVANASGLYRDLFPDKIRFLDNAIRHAATLTDVENFIRINDRRMTESLVSSGMEPGAAEAMAKARIFSESPGAYGNRVSELVSASGLWQDDASIADTFLRHTGYAYGENFWGVPAQPSLSANLADASVAWHSSSSNLYGLMDNDDMFMYLGGMSLAITRLSGHSPTTVITEQRSGDAVTVRDLRFMLGREMRSRYLNPKWIEGMMADNYAGAGEMSKYVEHLWGWQVTAPDDVDVSMWSQTYDVYVADKYGMDVKEFMADANPWAFQSLTSRMLEAVRKGYWSPPESVRSSLAAEYAMNVITKGVACCDHTCNNPQLNQMVMTLISLPGVLSPEIATQFKLAMEQSAQKSLEEQVRERQELLQSLGSQPKAPKEPEAGSRAEDPETVKGLKMEPLDQEDEAELASSGVQWYAAFLVLGLLALFYLGMRRRDG
ncbi:MAG: cobaltochelatase subunit CobN [Planctomycetaceae bacterium]|nr:cobaltochelatase subunit CobN [Planctomycetaceae bacterium]